MTFAQNIRDVLARNGITIRVEGADLILDPAHLLDPEALAWLTEHKAEIVAGLLEELHEVIFDAPEIDAPPPCSACGGLDLWQNLRGAWACALCDPPTASRRWLALADRLRRARN